MTNKNILERLGVTFRPFTKDDETAFSGVESDNPEIGFSEIEDREGSIIRRPIIAIILDGEKTSIVGIDREGDPFDVRLTFDFIIGGPVNEAEKAEEAYREAAPPPPSEVERESEITRFYSDTVDFAELERSVRAVLGRSKTRDIYFREADNGTSDGIVLVSNLPINQKEEKDLLRFFDDLEIDFPDGLPE